VRITIRILECFNRFLPQQDSDNVKVALDQLLWRSASSLVAIDMFILIIALYLSQCRIEINAGGR